MLRRWSAVWPALALSVLPGCRRRDPSASPSSSAPSALSEETPPPEARRSCAPTVVAELPWPVTALFATPARLYGVSRGRGVVFSVSSTTVGGEVSVTTVSSSEREPFALVVRRGKPVWASSEGVFGANEDGTNRQTLKSDNSVWTLAGGPDGVYFTTPRHLWRVDWPRSAVADDVGENGAVVDAIPSELVVAGGWLAYLNRNKVWAYELATGRRQDIGQCPGGLCQAKPHDLSVAGDGATVVWHEGEADLLPGGREARAFAVVLATGSQAELPGHYDSSARYLLRRPSVYGPATCKQVESTEWTRLDGGQGGPPVADDPLRWYWVESIASDAGEIDRLGGKSRIIAAQKAECCR